MFSPGLPAPQTLPSPSASGLGDLFRAGSSFALGFLNLLGNQVFFINLYPYPYRKLNHNQNSAGGLVVGNIVMSGGGCSVIIAVVFFLLYFVVLLLFCNNLLILC